MPVACGLLLCVGGSKIFFRRQPGVLNFFIRGQPDVNSETDSGDQQEYGEGATCHPGQQGNHVRQTFRRQRDQAT